ncbi:MAG: OmpA family protein [Acidobacteriota bacterium]|nr:OmpA family protein [Acidobacteriota bacterium]MDH3784051.1 OmpA family protein [Acidobacteriota bacterium]
MDATGCPKDSDGDGVWDGIDRCPDTPAGAEVDERGCPKLFEDEKKSLVLEGVNFETNKAVLTSNSTTVLDRVVSSLKEWPEVRIEVGGHTDSSGADSYNQTLSEARARAVLDYLVEHGVSAASLSAKGYGESNPIADNGTRAGKATNRRVELTRQN